MMWLVDLLFTRGALTRAQIDDYWAKASLNDMHESCIPRRTFFRMKDDLLLLFDIEIEYNKHTGKFAIANTEYLKNNILKQWLIDNFAIRNTLSEAQQMQDRVLLENIPSGNKFLTIVADAMRQNVSVKIQYKSFQMSETREFEVMPYCLKVFKQRWYLFGPRVGNDEPHFYALDRVHNLSLTANKFCVPADFDATNYLRYYYGIMRDKTEPQTVQIRVTPFRANYIRTVPLHHSQKETEFTNEYSIFEYWLAPTADFIQELRSVLPEITVLQPQWLREKFIEEAKHILENYKKLI